MFLLPSLVLGVLFSLLLGGRPGRVLDVRLRRRWAVPASLAVQAVLFSPLAAVIPQELESPLHFASYGFLLVFAAANIHVLALCPVLLGMALNAIAIFANGGRMPVARAAWDAAGLEAGEHANVRLGADYVGFLGDVFALPARFPLANVFSVGDLLIGFGMVAFIVTVSTSEGEERPLVPARILRPLRVSAFRRLAAGKLISQLGDWLTLAALVGWIYGTTESTTQVAVLMLVRLLPPILGASLAASLVDRLSKERLLVAVELLRGAAVGGALGAVLLELRPLAFATVAASGALAAVSAATVPSLVPSLLDDEQLPAANAGLGIAQDGAMALGALAAGFALSASGAALALVVDLATFLVAAALFATIHPRRGSGYAAARSEEDENGTGFKDGLRYLLRRRLLLVVVMAFGAATIATGLTNATLPRLLDGLGFGAGGYGFGLSALAGGLALGQGFVGFARVGSDGSRWIGAGLAFMAALFAALAFTEHAPTAILLLGAIGFVDGATDVLFATIVQREADPRYYGRVFGLASAFMATTMMGAVAAAPLVNRIAPPGHVIFLAGVVLLAAATISLFATGRAHTTANEKAEEDEEEPPLAPVLTLVPASPEPTEAPPAPAIAPVKVVLRLNDGERIHIGSFPERAGALECARDVAAYLREMGTSEWPLIGTRFVRPELIVSVDIVEDRIAKWMTQPGAADELDGSVGSR